MSMTNRQVNGAVTRLRNRYRRLCESAPRKRRRQTIAIGNELLAIAAKDPSAFDFIRARLIELGVPALELLRLARADAETRPNRRHAERNSA
ncbi:MAG: hypothetical protein AAF328_00380 [Planctomycetota bacterium]